MFKKYLIQILSLLTTICFTVCGFTLFSSKVTATPTTEAAASISLRRMYTTSDYFAVSSKELPIIISSAPEVSSEVSSKELISSAERVSSKDKTTVSSKPKDYIEQLDDKLQDIPSSIKKKDTSSAKQTSSKKTSSKRTSSKQTSSKDGTASYYVDLSSNNSSSTSSETNEDEVIYLSVNGEVKEYSALDAVAGNVAAEMDDYFEDEAIKAQAVAAHTYMVYTNSLGKAPILPMRTPSNNIKKLVKSVIDKLIYYDNKPINAVYFATAGGYTANAKDIWGSEIPYLKSVESKYDSQASGYKSTKTYTQDNFKSIISDKAGITLSGDAKNWVKILSTVDGGYIGNISIGGKTKATVNGKKRTLTGYVLRDFILSYGIRSTKFEYSVGDGTVSFTTYGYGHGVGMSQNGANLYAKKEKRNYKWILEHYYTGVTIK